MGSVWERSDMGSVFHEKEHPRNRVFVCSKILDFIAFLRGRVA